MVREIAVFEVREGQGDGFVEAYNSVAHILTDAEGNHGAALYRGVEEPGSYTLIVEWDSVEAHTAVTEKPEFERFSDAVGPYLSGRPGVRHVEAVV